MKAIAVLELSDSIFDESNPRMTSQINLAIDILDNFGESIGADISKSFAKVSRCNNKSTVEIAQPAELFERCNKYQIYFKDIVGNGPAKAALHVNVVLPLCMTPKERHRLFSGIRAGK